MGGRCSIAEKQIKLTKTRLPENHKFISKRYYFDTTFMNAWRYHLAIGNVEIEDIKFRAIIYDALKNALENKFGKIHDREFLSEIEKFEQEYSEEISRFLEEDENFKAWKNYLESQEFLEFKEKIKNIDRFQKRAEIHIDMALSFIYAKYQKKWTDRILDLEKKLRLDLIPKLWSKKSFWLLMSLLVFDANNTYANTIANTKINKLEYDLKDDAIKINIIPWYERTDINVPDSIRWTMRIYNNLLVPASGEIGSVLIADITKQGLSLALIHIAKLLTNAVLFIPWLRGGLTLAKGLTFAAEILDRSILAWLGWQITVEWALDGWIQTSLLWLSKEIGRAFFYKPGTYLLSKEFEKLFKLAYKYATDGWLDDIDKMRYDELYNKASEKQKQVIDRMIKKIKLYQKLYNIKRLWRAEVKSAGETVDWIMSGYSKEGVILAKYGTIEDLEKWDRNFRESAKRDVINVLRTVEKLANEIEKAVAINKGGVKGDDYRRLSLVDDKELYLRAVSICKCDGSTETCYSLNVVPGSGYFDGKGELEQTVDYRKLKSEWNARRIRRKLARCTLDDYGNCKCLDNTILNYLWQYQIISGYGKIDNELLIKGEKVENLKTEETNFDLIKKNLNDFFIQFRLFSKRKILRIQNKCVSVIYDKKLLKKHKQALDEIIKEGETIERVRKGFIQNGYHYYFNWEVYYYYEGEEFTEKITSGWIGRTVAHVYAFEEIERITRQADKIIYFRELKLPKKTKFYLNSTVPFGWGTIDLSELLEMQTKYTVNQTYNLILGEKSKTKNYRKRGKIVCI